MKNLKYVKLFENFKKNKLINEDKSQIKKIGLVDKKYFEDTYFKKSETPPKLYTKLFKIKPRRFRYETRFILSNFCK